MRKTLLIAASLTVSLLLVATTGRAQDKKNLPGFGGPSSDVKQEQEIRKLYEKFTANWNKHDPKAMAAIWVIDGDQMEPDGRHAKGQADVEKLFTEEQKTVFKDSKLKLTIDTVWFVTETTALIDGSYELAGVKDLKGQDVPTRKGHLTSILISENGKWWVAAGRAMIPVPLSYRD